MMMKTRDMTLLAHGYIVLFNSVIEYITASSMEKSAYMQK